ncbi:MAG: hypothetical protein N2560_01295 [Ignavibacteria bacterium]|nr:hypothetical protein [Ignavibacteria bacterium]
MRYFWIITFSIIAFFSCNNKDNLLNPNNRPPVIDSISVNFDMISIVPAADIICYAHDPDGDQIRYRWRATAGEFIGSGYKVKYFIPPCCDSITNKITIEVFDIYDAKASLTFSIKPPRK